MAKTSDDIRAAAKIQMERFFTRAGQHPFDEIEWEIREARIGSADRVAFEQSDTEFPKSWSQNATNIVAQKYFRGPMNTPQRERSVRQMIGRVVDWYTNKGGIDGYLTSVDDADIFKSELTYLLVNQYMAFNSPVWFNVGLVDLPRVSACQPYYSLVNTVEGPIPIGKLVETNAIGRKVLDANGITQIEAVKSNGKKQVLRIDIGSHQLDVTRDHIVWRASSSDGTGRFVSASELEVGDRLVWVRTYSEGEGGFEIRDLAEAGLAGWLQTDGFVGRYSRTNKVWTIECQTVTNAEFEWVNSLLDEVFPDVHRKVTNVEVQDQRLTYRRIRVYGKSLEPFIVKWGLMERSTSSVVPEVLFTAPLPVVRHYLRSVFQAEGYVAKKPLNGNKVPYNGSMMGAATISPQLMRGVKVLLERFGILSRLTHKIEKRPDRHDTWEIGIGTLGDQMRFADEIGFVDPWKQDTLTTSFDRKSFRDRSFRTFLIRSISNLGEMDVYDIQTQSGEYLSDGIRVHNCFILDVEDEMPSILNWYVEEGLIFKAGSGAGINLSKLRSSKEQLTSGGTASGPVSFMRGADASAGTIKSGGSTRRAAKMVVLDVDHPDVEEFINCKVREEDKARALREAGFDMDLDGADSHSLQYQNANNSVGLSDEFINAYIEDKDWDLKAVKDGRTVKTMRSRDIMRQIAEAAWKCADPGVFYLGTMNQWHTSPSEGPIRATNPCFPGDARVHTDKGLIRFDEMMGRVIQGETFGVYTHDATSKTDPQERIELTSPTQFMVTGMNEILRLSFSNGAELRCTPNHKIFTTNRGMVPAKELTDVDAIKALNLPTPAIMADWALPNRAIEATQRRKSEQHQAMNLPEKWSEELADYLGWLIGDGCSSENGFSTIYGTVDDQEVVLPRHQRFLTGLNGGREPKIAVQANGTQQLRVTRHALIRFIEALGLRRATAAGKRVPTAIFTSPVEIQAAFLRSLFDADGCVSISQPQKGSRYVGLSSRSNELLKDVQLLLSSFGINSRIYKEYRHGNPSKFEYVKKDGTRVSYESRTGWDLRIFSKSIAHFAAQVGFSLPSKVKKLESLLSHEFYEVDTTTRLVRRDSEGFELTYNLTEPRNHSYTVGGYVVANCGEFLRPANTSCNLASLRLTKFVGADGEFDVAAFTSAVETTLTAMDISVTNAEYPTEKITKMVANYRELGIGYTDLGALLMDRGVAYDSDEGRAWAAAITALMSGVAYRRSAELASALGPYPGWEKKGNPQAHLDVVRRHRDSLGSIDSSKVPADILEAAQTAWDQALALGETYGYRNAQVSLIAPTGTISFLMDADTTGIEPDLALVKTKKLVGGGTMKIVNQRVPQALKRLGYAPDELSEILSYISENNTVKGAPFMKPEHYSVFDCAMGDSPIHYMGHVKMMSAVQPFLSGAISKTVNMPEDASVDEIEELYIEGWKMGLKNLAIYRDNCKVAQPLNADKKKSVTAQVASIPASEQPKPVRRRLPRKRNAQTMSFRIADCDGYVMAGEYPDTEELGEIFLKVAKQGSTLSGIMDAFAISVSLGLQYGVPLKAYVEKFINMRFEPSGITDDADFRFASSIVDYIFRRLAADYLTHDEREAVNIKTTEERQASLDGGVPITPNGHSSAEVATDMPTSSWEAPTAPRTRVDAPLCYTCGISMQPAGSCFVCESCGTTSGCS